MRGFRFKALSEKGRESLNNRILLNVGASRWEKMQFKALFGVDVVCKDPFTLDVCPKSLQLSRRLHPDIMIATLSKELFDDDGVVKDDDFSVEVLK